MDIFVCRDNLLDGLLYELDIKAVAAAVATKDSLIPGYIQLKFQIIVQLRAVQSYGAHMEFYSLNIPCSAILRQMHIPGHVFPVFFGGIPHG